MKKFSIKGLAKIIKAHAIRNTQYAIRDFTGVSTDSRTTKAGDCFFAIAGENFDGADFLSDAFAKGAVCAVVSKKLNAIRYTLYANRILKVDDTVKALGDFAREYRRQNNFKVVAITGSVGKTTTRQITYHILRQHFRVFQAPKNFNNFIGLPLTLLGADPEDKIVLVELASNHPGEIAYLTRIALPDIAVVTNVHPAHLAGLGDIETIIQEKLSISEGLQPDGVLIINADFERLVSACRTSLGARGTGHGARGTGHGARVITFGKSETAYLRAQNIVYNDIDSSFTIGGTRIYLPLPGAGNVENALAACSICSQFAIRIDDFAQAVKTLSPVPMRAELMQVGTLTILDDCYNANPTSMKNALDILAKLGQGQKRPAPASPVARRGGGRLVFICGDMAELGRRAQALHIELGASIARAKIQLLFAVGKFAKIAAEAAKKIAKYDLQTEAFEDTLSACNNLEKFIKDYDIILVKASRVARMEIVIERLKELFS